MALILCSVSSLAATVGLVVEEKSDKAKFFQQQLAQLRPQDEIVLVPVKALADASKVQRWIAIGVKSLAAVLAQSDNSKPILGIFVRTSARGKLQALYPNRHFSILDNVPSLDKQLALIKVLSPQSKRVALYHSAQYRASLNSVQQTAQALGLDILLTELKDPLNWDRKALKTLKEADLILGVNDDAIYNATNIRSILMRLYRGGKALIGPDKGYVRAGAVASVFAGVQETLKACADLLASAQPWPEQIVNPYFNVTVNGQVARSLNITTGKSEQLVKEVRALLP